MVPDFRYGCLKLFPNWRRRCLGSMLFLGVGQGAMSGSPRPKSACAGQQEDSGALPLPSCCGDVASRRGKSCHWWCGFRCWLGPCASCSEPDSTRGRVVLDIRWGCARWPPDVAGGALGVLCWRCESVAHVAAALWQCWADPHQLVVLGAWGVRQGPSPPCKLIVETDDAPTHQGCAVEAATYGHRHGGGREVGHKDRQEHGRPRVHALDGLAAEGT